MIQAERDSTNSEDIVLELKHVSKHFGDVHAVEDATLNVHRGEVLTLLGPSGCGKTTTLRMVVGLERVTRGEIIYNGEVMDSDSRRVFVPTNKRNMGMVFQSYAIWPHMTVAENVGFPLKVRRVKRVEIQERVSRALEKVGLAGYEKRPATALSGGQQQRVAVARSLVFEPDILLLDEPFSNLDAKLRDQMRTELRVLQRRLGITVLFVTHDQIEALSISDRIVVMHLGNIEQVGTPTELYMHPKTAVVRDFLGKTIILEGTIEESSPAGVVTIRVHDRTGPLLHAQVPEAQDYKKGDRCLMAVRPEGVEVDGRDESSDPETPNTINAILSTLLFIGDRYEARVILPWEQEIFLYLPQQSQLREGQTVTLKVAPESLHVWPPAEATVQFEEEGVPTIP